MYSEQPNLYNGRPLYIRIYGGINSDPMVVWYVPNPAPGRAGLWMINNMSEHKKTNSADKATAKAAVKDAALTPHDISSSWKVFNPTTKQFANASSDVTVEFATPEEIEEYTITSLTVHGRTGYNRAMNGVYTRGEGSHCGKSYWNHTANDFTIRWYERKWVIDWRVGLHNDNVGAAVCKENVPEPWMCSIPWRVYDGRAPEKDKWKWDQELKIKHNLPDEE